MANRTFDLLFLQDDGIAHIYVKTCSRGAYKGHEDKILITRKCMDIGELEYCANSMKEELDRVVSAARKEFAEARR
ncbi:MAG: hypothetical protein ABR866_09505 [Candidatus Korobacteraceae bacterium]|jgi:hypothetical protein